MRSLLASAGFTGSAARALQPAGAGVDMTQEVAFAEAAIVCCVLAVLLAVFVVEDCAAAPRSNPTLTGDHP